MPVQTCLMKRFTTFKWNHCPAHLCPVYPRMSDVVLLMRTSTNGAMELFFHVMQEAPASRGR